MIPVAGHGLMSFVSRQYPLILLGPDREAYQERLTQLLEARLAEIGLSSNELYVCTTENTTPKDVSRLAEGFAVALWFGHPIRPNPPLDLELLNAIHKSHQIPIYPVSETLTDFSTKFPSALHRVNGLPWLPERIVAEVLGAFQLTRPERQVFISYYRRDSSRVAAQLYHELQMRGFQVFLDSASVKPGTMFQEVLLGRLGDIDLLLVLDSPNFTKDSEWTYVELQNSLLKAIGGLRLIWPADGRQRPVHGTQRTWDEAFSLFDSRNLTVGDFEGNLPPSMDSGNADVGQFTPATLQLIVNQVEEVRIKSLAKRRSRVFEELMSHLNQRSVSYTIKPFGESEGGMNQSRYSIIDVEIASNNVARIYPVVGFPDAWVHQARHDEIRPVRSSLSIAASCIAYDEVLATADLKAHLTWLSENVSDLPLLPVSSLSAWLDEHLT